MRTPLQVAALPDPVGEILHLRQRPSGIQVGQMRVPIGVFGMIYESRPNVTIEAACLAIKSGNARILRAALEALHSNLALWQCASRPRKRACGPCGAAGPHHRPRSRGPAHQPAQHIDVVIPREAAVA